MLRVGLVGCAHIHVADAIAAIESRADVGCTGVWDPDSERAAAIAARIGAPALELDALLGSVDAAIVLSETAAHPALIDAVAGAGLDLFVEKPLAIDAAGARAAAARIEAAGARFDTGYFLRELPAVAALRSAIAAGELGQIVRARGRFAHDAALRGGFAGFEWMLDPARAGRGALGDLGVHAIDVIGWLTGQRVEAVAAHAGDRSGAGIDDHGAALLRLDGGAIASIEASWIEPGAPLAVEVWGTRGAARLADGLEPASAAALHRFFDALVGRREPGALVSPAVAADHCAVIEACYASARSGQWRPILRG